MNYRGVLLITELEWDWRAALAAIRCVAPRAERLVVLARLPARTFAWLSREAPPDLQEAANVRLAELRIAAADVARSVEVRLAADLSTESLEELAASSQIDLLAAGSLPFSSLPVVAELRKRRSIAVLWIPEKSEAHGQRRLTNLVCVAVGRQARAAVGAFLRDHGDPGQRVTVLASPGPAPGDLLSAIDVAGVRTAVEFVTPEGQSPRRWLEERMQHGGIDLLVFARVPMDLLLSTRWSALSLLLPPAPVARPALQRGIDAPDLVDDGGTVRARFEYAVGVGRRMPIPDQQMAFVSGGQVAAVVSTHEGDAELPSHCQADSYGVFRIDGYTGSDPFLAVEQRLRVLRPGTAPLVLFDADLPDDELPVLRGLGGACEVLAVRIHATRSYRSIRDRVRAAGVTACVIDGSLVLDEGGALDVPDAVDAVRLARVAARMRGVGFPVVAIVHREGRQPAATGFAALRAYEIAAGRLLSRPIPDRADPLAARLGATTGTQPIAGNRVEIELDNVKARQWLLAAIESSTRRVHLQVYMVADDEVGRQIELALTRAGERGVTVRVLVDSLHALHGSFGARNALLDRLGCRTGIEVRVSRPITAMPSLEDLKQRDHRKLAVIDNRLALLGGRNISHEYYTGFDEVVLTPHSMWREVPWLDAGARVEGPALGLLERSFLESWVEAGGAPFDVADVAAVGPTVVRVVIHRGLGDAYTLEAYLALIETAKSHLHVVNGFPLILEIQHALLRAVRRGVRVRALFGHLTPTHAGELFTGPWASARSAATSLVHSRMDALIAAGGEGYQFAVAECPAWARGLGAVSAHVHAKLMSVDGRVCVVGSANMDITAGYWESELLLVVEDAPIASAIECRVEELMAGSMRVERDDPQWQALARRREWMRHWPGVLSV